MRDTTIIYYTSQRELPEFEWRIRRALRRLAVLFRLPIISVSQQPLDFGKNICVGDVGTSPLNAFRQLQIGATAARTMYVCTAESDFVYPPDYFRLASTDPEMFRLASPVWVLFAGSRRAKVFVRKAAGDAGAMKVGRERLISRIADVLHGFPQWAIGEEGRGFRSLVDPHEVTREIVQLERPLVSFKTDQNMHRKTVFHRSSKTVELPYWGNVHRLIKRYMG